ncbi:MAG: AmmeMemoRadiSam system protein B [Chloroflexota bacterium]
MTDVSIIQQPKLRNLDVRPILQQGRPYLLLRDPLQVTEKPMLLPQPLASALAFCNGECTVDEIADQYKRHHGFPLEMAYFCKMIATLDETYLLDNERSAEAHYRALMAYRGAPSRPPFLAGQSYPATPQGLEAYFNGYLADVIPQNRTSVSQPMGRGLLSPHIDYQRGGAVYAQVWQRAAETARNVDLVIMFGTDHYGTDLFTLTRQHYATPYGILPTPLSIVDALASEIGDEAAYAGELRHKGEHSLELVATWLHHMRGGRPCELVPILVGGFHSFMHDNISPEDHPHIQSILRILYSHMQNKNVLVVASGDMAHVGPAFGGEPLSSAERKKLRKHDDALLSAMKQGNSVGFFKSICAVEDRNNVCGVSPIYLTMRLLEMNGGQIRGEQHGYDVCPADEQGSSVVTISGVLFS